SRAASLARLNVLIAWADPATPVYAHLPHVREEAESVQKALASHGFPVNVKVVENATPMALQGALKEFQPHILHFIGHGEQFGRGLALQDSEPGEKIVSWERLAEWLPDSLRLVVLSACDTAGIAQSAAMEHIPALLTMQSAWNDVAARA